MNYNKFMVEYNYVYKEIDKMKKLIALLLCLLVFTCAACGQSNNGNNSDYIRMTVEKQAGKDFKILQLTDIQIIDPNQQPYEGRISAGAAAMWADRDACAFNLVRELVTSEKPDFIVLTGDNVYGQFDADGSNFKALVDLMDSFNIPWSFVNGNHDGETAVYQNGIEYKCGKGMAWQADYAINKTKNCLYEIGDSDMGYGNYIVNLKEDGKIVYSFVMMDTHGCDMPVGLTDEQVAWYESEIRKASEVRYGKADLSAGVVPSLMFFHYPTVQHRVAMINLNDRETGTVSEDGMPLPNGDYGCNRERSVSFDSYDLWDVLKKMNSTKGIFVGHNHVNNASIMHEGVRLTFGTKTGTYDSWYQQGGTRITLKDGSLDLVVEPIYTSQSQYGYKD